jgi:hypothetical protein
MKTLFANIVNSGTQESHSPKENQTARLINRVALIFIFAVLPNAAFMSHLRLLAGGDRTGCRYAPHGSW